MKKDIGVNTLILVLILSLLTLGIVEYVQFLKTWGFLPTDVIFMVAALLIAFLIPWKRFAAGKKPKYINFVTGLCLLAAWTAFTLFTSSRESELLKALFSSTVFYFVLFTSRQSFVNPPVKSDAE